MTQGLMVSVARKARKGSRARTGPPGLLASLASGVLKGNQGSKATRAARGPRAPRATKDSWARWVAPETQDPLAPQALKAPGAAWDPRELQVGWGPKETRDWLVTMDTKALWDPSGLLDQKAKRGSRVRMARPRGPLGRLEIGALWVTEETVVNLGTQDILDRRVFKASVESPASRANPGIRDPGGGRDPKDQKAKRVQRESRARSGPQVGGGSRGCQGCLGLGAWWEDRAPRVSLDQMGFLAGMAEQDHRESKGMMGTLALWALLGGEEIQVWPACLELRGPQDSRVKVGYQGSWVPLADEGPRAERGFLGSRGSQDPKASRVTLVRWASQECLASLDPRAPLETSASKASRALGGLLA